MTTLTKAAIDALKPGEVLKDDRVPGLSVRAHKTGKSFMLYYRTRNGDERRPRLGVVGVMSIDDARKVAKNMLAKVSAGQDPKGEADKAKAAPTVADLWKRVEREHYCRGRRWDDEAKRIWRIYLEPKLGHKRVAEIGYDEVMEVHNGLRKTPYQANRVIAVLSKMLKLAEPWKMRPVGSNPCQHVVRAAERKRRRYASQNEIAAIGAELDSHAASHPAEVAFLYILMFSGARPSEIERATPDMLERVERDGEPYGILRLDGKTGERTVLLPPQAMAVIDRLPRGRKSLAGRASLPRHIWEKVREKIDAPDLWARDLRRTFATVALSNGVSSSMIGELLGHKSAQTTKIYAKLMEDPGLKAAAAVATLIEHSLKKGGDNGKVAGAGGAPGAADDGDGAGLHAGGAGAAARAGREGEGGTPEAGAAGAGGAAA
jgi:integrase